MGNRFGVDYDYPCEREWRCVICGKKFTRFEKNRGTTRRVKTCGKKCWDERKELIRQGKMKSTTLASHTKEAQHARCDAAPDAKVGKRRNIEDIPGPTKYDLLYG